MVYAAVLAMLAGLILVHEAGHLVAARLMGLPVARFSVGFGPRLCGFQWKETDYCISLIPLGGYVMLKLDTLEDMFRISVFKRIVYLAAGPLANLLFVLPVFIVMNIYLHGWNMHYAVIQPLLQSDIMVRTVMNDLVQLFHQPDQVGGIIGMVSESSKVISNGFGYLCVLTAYLSVNFAVMNMLPVPILDGGQILLSLMEKVAPYVKQVRIPLAIAGWVLMLALILYATVMDISRLYT